MLKEMRAHRKIEFIAGARRRPLSDPGVEYPAWYMQRWHFLPEGYFSDRSITLHDRLIRRLYNQGADASILRSVVREVVRERPSTIVEIGCGAGRGLAEARRQSDAALIGVDLSPFMLEAAKRRVRGPGSVTLIHADARSIPLQSGTADVLFAVHVLGHVPHLVADEIISEAARVLRTGGRLIQLDHSWHRRPELKGAFRAQGSREMLGGLQTLTVHRREPGTPRSQAAPG